MQEIEYIVSGNRIGLFVKYPRDIQKKWSESFADLQCNSCNGDNISSCKSGDMLTITCHDCVNFWYGYVSDVLTTYNTEEATVNLSDTPFSGKE